MLRCEVNVPDYPPPNATRAEIEAWEEAKREARLMPIAREIAAEILGTTASKLVAEMATEAHVGAVLRRPRRGRRRPGGAP